MDIGLLQLIVYLIVFLIYFIFGGNRIRLANNDLFLGETFYFEDSLAELRNEYNIRLRAYYQHNKPKLYLINRNCEAKLLKDKNGKVSFYVKERTVFNKPGKYFEVKGDSAHAYTMWSIIDMEFNELTRYDDIKDLYKSLNQGYDTRGGMRYYKEPILRRLPKPIKNECAQNEFCKMEIKQLSNEKFILVCSEIWGILDYKNAKKFVIMADKFKLFDILKEFIKEKNKMQDYFTLLAKYAVRTDIKIEEIEIKQQQEEVKPEQKLNQPEKASKTEEVKYLHVNIETTPSEEYEEQKKKHTKIEPNEVLEPFPEKTEEQNKRYNERKLDL